MLTLRIFKSVAVLTLAGSIGACGGPEQRVSESAETAVAGRWYSQRQVAAGGQVFSNNCAVCHGANAEGTVANWQRRLADGSLPPPPLNGSAHAWHHPRSVLLQVINEGGIPLGGSMPAFDAVLEDDEKMAAIAYFQSFWDDEIYQQWGQMGGTN